ncbi:MAG: hypothetical protein HC853_07595 [Anaerolineae bacterium]|nr:hypothetical protein [Anaerolineae bacterium]
MAFDFSLETLTAHASRDERVGLVFRQAKTSNPRLGADLILTCDWATQSVLVAHFLIGVSQAHALELHCISLDARIPLYERPVDPRAIREGYVPEMIRPHTERFWAYLHEDAAPMDPREIVGVGWPPDLPDLPRWHYTSCSGATWAEKTNDFEFQATQVDKVLAGKPDSGVTLLLANNELNLFSEVEHDLEELEKIKKQS